MFVLMKRVIKVFVLLLFVLQAVASYAQEKYDFVKEAGASAALFRGVEFERYPFRYKDSPYAYSEEFNLGEIVFNDVKYSGVFLNLNAHKDEFCVYVFVLCSPFSSYSTIISDCSILAV